MCFDGHVSLHDRNRWSAGQTQTLKCLDEHISQVSSSSKAVCKEPLKCKSLELHNTLRVNGLKCLDDANLEDRAPRIAMFKPSNKARSESDDLKCPDEHTTLDDHNTPTVLLGEFVGITVDGVHDTSRGTVEGDLLAGQHGGP